MLRSRWAIVNRFLRPPNPTARVQEIEKEFARYRSGHTAGCLRYVPPTERMIANLVSNFRWQLTYFQMKAIVIHEAGGPEVLNFEEVSLIQRPHHKSSH